MLKQIGQAFDTISRYIIDTSHDNRPNAKKGLAWMLTILFVGSGGLVHGISILWRRLRGNVKTNETHGKIGELFKSIFPKFKPQVFLAEQAKREIEKSWNEAETEVQRATEERGEIDKNVNFQKTQEEAPKETPIPTQDVGMQATPAKTDNRSIHEPAGTQHNDSDIPESELDNSESEQVSPNKESITFPVRKLFSYTPEQSHNEIKELLYNEIVSDEVVTNKSFPFRHLISFFEEQAKIRIEKIENPTLEEDSLVQKVHHKKPRAFRKQHKPTVEKFKDPLGTSIKPSEEAGTLVESPKLDRALIQNETDKSRANKKIEDPTIQVVNSQTSNTNCQNRFSLADD